ncbi:MAG: hypothetical protein JNJ73_04820 [Hyphomonadaceae bacterium]|nr:hypothetical protein [Hyphomonadaceae bacterium]
MKFVCDAPGGKSWFRLETEAEAEAESALMRHAVEKYFQRALAEARESYTPGLGIERDIGLKTHIAKKMPRFLTLRADDGTGLATAMLPPEIGGGPHFRVIVVGAANSDPYPEHGDAIRALATHLGMRLPRSECFPYA